MPISDEGRAKVFISYSHQDDVWLKRLQVHLKPLERDGLIDRWDDTRIQAGSQWRHEIKSALDMAQVAVLLISADFMASDFIATDELPLLLAAAGQKGVVILPLIVSPSRFEKTESLSCFQTVNPPSKPLIGLERAKQEEILVKLTEDILSALKGPSSGVRSAKPTSCRQVSNLPMPRNDYFTGREDIIEKLRAGFMSGQSTQALSGLGGVGKTQTALEYAYRYEQEYQFVLWAKANTRESLTSDYVAIASLLNLPEKDEQDQTTTIAAVKRWLENHSDWLLILDNADDLAMAREFLPTRKAGHILLTTRAQNTKPIAVPHEVKKMNSREGALFLLSRLGVIKKGDPLESAATALSDEAEALSTSLDGLPLALDQAAAFIEEQPSTLQEYRQLYEKTRGELLNRRGDLADDHPSVTVTFSLAFDQVSKANPAAADLLRICAFLEADAIPEEIFSEGAMELGESIRAANDSPLGLSDAFKEARRFSLLQRNLDARTISVHRLVQAVIKDEIEAGARRIWAGRVVRAVNNVFPNVEYSTWPVCDRLIAHAHRLAEVIKEYGFEFLGVDRLLNETGVYLIMRAQYNRAVPILERALMIREKALGVQHPYTAQSLNNLAGCYKEEARYDKAELLYERALAINEKVLGPEHPYTAMSLNNLAALYESLGRYESAEPLYERGLEIIEKSLGGEHPDMAQSLNNLAGLYYAQGRYEKAELLYERALAINEKVLGPEHPSTAKTLNNLAGLYGSQGIYEKAELLFERALAIREKSLGGEHPDIAQSLNNLAGLYYAQGRYEKAELLYEQALAIWEQVLGAKHPDTATALNNLALLYYAQGIYGKAEPLYERALAVNEKVLGPEHPSTAKTLNNLAGLYGSQGIYEKAEPLFERALAINEKVLGAEHPSTAQSLNNLAGLYYAQGSYEKAEPLLRRGIQILLRASGEMEQLHPYIKTALERYYEILIANGQDEEAAMETMTRVFAPE